MNLKTLFTIFFSIFVTLHVVGQKKSLTHDDYASWKKMNESGISNNGQIIYYTLNPQKGDDTLFIQSDKGDTLHIFPRGNHTHISYDSKYVAFKIAPQLDTVRQAKLNKVDKDKLPKDSLGIYFTQDDKVWKYSDLISYQYPEKWSGWIALLQEEKEDTTKHPSDTLQSKPPAKPAKVDKEDVKTGKLTLLNLADSSTFSISNVHNYCISPEGKMAFFLTSTKDSTAHSAAYAYNFANQKLTLLDSSQIHYETISSDRWGNQAAYLATSDTIDADYRQFRLFYWKKGAENIQLIKLSGSDFLQKDWAVSRYRRPSFSYDGTLIYLGVAPKVFKTAYEKDTTILDEERVHVDIWSWKDPLLQPQQLNQLDEELKRSYLGCFDLFKNTFTLLANQDVPDVWQDKDLKLDMLIGISDVPYKQMISWEWPIYQDFYLIDVHSGKRTLIKRKSKGTPRLSPEGKYVYWFEPIDGNWYTYQVSNGETKNITIGKNVAFYDVEHDTPSEAPSYGAAGWTKNDDYFLVYDQYDIWALGPSAKKAPYIVTDTLGRKNKWQFRYNDLNKDLEYIPNEEGLILSVFDFKTKAAGYFLDSLSSSYKAQSLIWDDAEFSDLKKAQQSTQLIYRKGSFIHFNDLYTTNLFFQKPKKLSNANTQQKDILWGSAELMNWRSFDGDSLTGIIYKPEKFDSLKKYPVIVYFYEQYSDRIHHHYIPTASRSIVNFPYLTSNDYVVFVPDIKYKNGYPGMSAYNCIMPGVSKLIQQGYIDEKNMAIQGQSWGGYQVAYLVTRTGMFKAAMAGAPVSNMTSAYGGIRWGTGMSRMFQYETTQSRIGGTLWDKHMLYIENSPVFYADRVSTPLLIMHNDNDGAVPWYQGIEYFVALRRLHKPVWMLVYNGEQHNLTDWDNRMDLSIRMMQFFDHYLKGKPAPEWMEKGIPAIKKGKTLGY